VIWTERSKTRFRGPGVHVDLNAFLLPLITNAPFPSSVDQIDVWFISSVLIKLELKLTMELGNIAENSTYPKTRQSCEFSQNKICLHIMAQSKLIQI
jgi:hypothetical protein